MSTKRVSQPQPSVASIQRAVGRHITHARKALLDGKLDDEGVHAARKELKRARSGLRLLRPLDETAYQRENMRLRNAARRLAPVRDHKVLLAHITRLLAGEKNPARRKILLGLRKDLYNARRRDWRALRSPKELERIDGVLADAARQVRKWPAAAQAADDAGAAPAAAVQRLYRNGRKAVERTLKDPTDEHLHEARKQAKHLSQALEILAGRKPPRKAKKILSRAKHVGDWLGDDHDLAVVESRVATLPGAAGDGKKLKRRLEERRSRLQEKALDAADKLFRKKTKRVLMRAADHAPAAA